MILTLTVDLYSTSPAMPPLPHAPRRLRIREETASVRRSRSVLGGMFAEQLAPYLPNFPFSPTEAKFIGAPIDFLVFKGMDAQPIEESDLSSK